MVLTFILISIIVVGTLDSVNIFGDNQKGNMINLAVGIIISIIGVRFMPSNMWESLTAPSSAFVATVLVGAPFLAVFFVTMKIKHTLARKLLWLFYLIFMSYLIFTASGGNDFKWIYTIFLASAVVMLFAEGIIRVYINKQSKTSALYETLGLKDSERLAKIEGQINELTKAIDSTRSADIKRDLNKLKGELIEEYKRISGSQYYSP